MQKVCTRQLDALGRIVISKEARTRLDFKFGAFIDMYVDDEYIYLKKNCDLPSCQICGNNKEDLKMIEHIYLCNNCIDKIKTI